MLTLYVSIIQRYNIDFNQNFIVPQSIRRWHLGELEFVQSILVGHPFLHLQIEHRKSEWKTYKCEFAIEVHMRQWRMVISTAWGVGNRF